VSGAYFLYSCRSLRLLLASLTDPLRQHPLKSSLLDSCSIGAYSPSRPHDRFWVCLRLLGTSAFAGFIVLLLGWPLNSYLTNRRIRMQKALLGAADKRMGVLNELIGAVRFETLNPRYVIGSLFFRTGQVYQVLCMGRSLDSEGAWCPGGGDEVDGQRYVRNIL